MLVSSHILAEIEHACDSVAILRRGRCIIDGPVASVLASAGPAQHRVGLDDLVAVVVVLRGADLTVSRVDGQIWVAVAQERAGDISRLLAERLQVRQKMSSRVPLQKNGYVV